METVRHHGSDNESNCAIPGALSPSHLSILRDSSAISDSVILARGYRTVIDPAELEPLGFGAAQRRVPGLLLPLWTPDGRQPISVYRPDNPRVVEDRRRRRDDGTYENRVVKYELPRGAATRLDCPPPCRPLLADPAVPLWVTEGQKKADSLASRGLRVAAVALLGVWNWRGKNDRGGTTFLNDWDYIALDGRRVILIFDSDLSSKPHVRDALRRLAEHLQRRRAHVSVAYLPPASDGSKVGVDDYLAAGHTLADLEALIEAPRLEVRPAEPIIELLDEAPAVLRCPLALVDGRAYAATWLPVRQTITETVDKHGQIVQVSPPQVTTARRLFVVRDDALIFGAGGDRPLDDLGMDVLLPEIPPAHQLWSTAGLKAYRSGQRPDPPGVFSRVADVVDRFIDFDHSLASQRTMAEMIACYILSTWFLDAFTVVGFLWSNGDRGCGKTQLLTIVTELAYLGRLILSGGSYASIRDLADYRACLAFDDAEELSDPRRTDPDKRALLLAGNRRGSTVPVKELGADRAWHTRYVNTFCPRLFSAIRLPDPVLASRAIVVPLVRSPDRDRANADVLDSSLWPHDRAALLSDLWAMALAHLAELPSCEDRVKRQARLTGRNLEPWRGLLAVAVWLTDKGVAGLWDRLEALSVAYQAERPALEYADLSALVFEALCRCAVSAVQANGPETHTWILATSHIAEVAARVAREQDSDISPEMIDSRKVGRVMGKMRLKKEPRPGGQGPHRWRVTLSDLQRWSAAYNLPLPPALTPPAPPPSSPCQPPPPPPPRP